VKPLIELSIEDYESLLKYVSQTSPLPLWNHDRVVRLLTTVAKLAFVRFLRWQRENIFRRLLAAGEFVTVVAVTPARPSATRIVTSARF